MLLVNHTLVITFDFREHRCGVPAALERLDAKVEANHLAVAYDGVGGGVLVERKTVRDLHQSIVRGRFWRQLGSLRHTATVPYLLIEGFTIDNGPLDGQAIRGACLAAVANGIRLLRTANPRDCGEWLYRLAPDDWMKVAGLGDRKGARLAEALGVSPPGCVSGAHPVSPSSRSEEGPGSRHMIRASSRLSV